MSDGDGLVCAYMLDGKGGGREVSWADLYGEWPPENFIWVHFQRTGAKGRQWIFEKSGIDPVIADALFGSEEQSTEEWIKEGHPRCLSFLGGIAVNLRGMNLNPGADPSDMVSLRAWIHPEMAVTVRQRHIMAIDDIKKSIANGAGPKEAGDFIATLCARLVDRMTPALTSLQGLVDELEENVLADHSDELRTRLGSLRRDAITNSRHIVPQRDALTTLSEEHIGWLDESHRARLQGVANRISRHVETLGFIRERATVIQDEITNHMAQRSNQTMFILSVVAGIFLPVTFITGLLGMNVGGMPGIESPWAFGIVTGLLLVIAVIEVWIFRRFNWF